MKRHTKNVIVEAVKLARHKFSVAELTVLIDVGKRRLKNPNLDDETRRAYEEALRRLEAQYEERKKKELS